MIVWTREAAGVYVGTLEGRRVARIKKGGGGRWAYSYRFAGMGVARPGEPCDTLRDAKVAVERSLGVQDR